MSPLPKTMVVNTPRTVWQFVWQFSPLFECAFGVFGGSLPLKARVRHPRLFDLDPLFSISWRRRRQPD
jgi:hypothetical protein